LDIWLINASGWPDLGSGFMLPLFVAIPAIFLLETLIGLFGGGMIIKLKPSGSLGFTGHQNPFYGEGVQRKVGLCTFQKICGYSIEKKSNA